MHPHHRPLPTLLTLVTLLAGGGLAGCRAEPTDPTLLRLGDLLSVPESRAVVVARDLAVSRDQTTFVEVGIDAARYDALEIEARGTAQGAQLGWKLAIEGRMQPYRRLDFPLLGDDREETYRIDLQREPYWSGRVARLAITARGGDLEIVAILARGARSPYRDMVLAGVSTPSLPGLRRIEIPLGADLPPRARFETRVGIVPQYDLEGTRARFRVSVENGTGERLGWAATELVAEGARGGGSWRRIEAEVEIPDRGTLVLETEIERDGHRLPEGTVVWGNPLLTWGGPPRQRNLVVILVDTLRADAVGAFGARHRLTPEIDALAARSVKLENLFAPSPWTLPSAASLMTGLHPQTHGAGRRLEGFAPTGLTDAPRTLAEVLAEAGYYTAGIYDNIYLNTAFGLQQGFDSYATYDQKGDFLVDRSLELLAATRDRPVFLFLHLFDPHNPYEPPEEDCRRVLDQVIGDSANRDCAADRRPDLPLPSPADRPRIEALYHAEVSFTDRQIGRLLAGLEELGLAERTVIALVSDHGEDFWRRLPQQEAYGYRTDGDHGHTHYRELLEVPGLLYIPGREPGVLRRAVELVDLYPTLLGLLEVEAPPNQGRDLRPALAGRPLKTPLLVSDVLLWGRPRWAVQEGSWRLVAPHEGSGPVELFDLDRDPGERVNRASERPDLVERLLRIGRGELEARGEMRASLLDDSEAVSATYLEWRHITKLRALGYLE